MHILEGIVMAITKHKVWENDETFVHCTFFLFEYLRSKNYFGNKLSNSIQQIGIILQKLNIIVREGYYEGLFSKERVGIPSIM